MSEKKIETMLLRTPSQTPLSSPLVVEAAGQRYKQTVQCLNLDGLINETTDIMPESKRRVRLAWACVHRFKLKLYDMETAFFAPEVRMLKSEVMETLLYG